MWHMVHVCLWHDLPVICGQTSLLCRTSDSPKQRKTMNFYSVPYEAQGLVQTAKQVLWNTEESWSLRCLSPFPTEVSFQVLLYKKALLILNCHAFLPFWCILCLPWGCVITKSFLLWGNHMGHKKTVKSCSKAAVWNVSKKFWLTLKF